MGSDSVIKYNSCVIELVLVVRPTLAEANRKKLVESVKALLKGVKVTVENDWGSKALAYPIKKEPFDKTQLFHVSFGTRF